MDRRVVPDEEKNVQDNKENIIRACAALIRGDHILMVRHRFEGQDYYTLPGGAVETDETPENAAERELREETGLNASVDSVLFDEPYRNGICRCFLMQEPDSEKEPLPGYDPEEVTWPKNRKTLQGLAWKKLIEMNNDKQVSLIIPKWKEKKLL